jgi:hypothetical protein
MPAVVRPLWAPKHGSSEAEYEDAFWPLKSAKSDDQVLRLAVADGATESSFARGWARLLVRGFGSGELDTDLGDTALHSLQRRWDAQTNRDPLPWYAEEKRASGAFSTLLGLELDAGSSDETCSRRWRAVAIGDSCLVQLRGDRVLACFPVERSADFDSRPFLLASVPSRNVDASEHVRCLDGEWALGDVFLLMTDALACWFIRQMEQGGTPWVDVQAFGNSPRLRPFRAWVQELRAADAMRNDDVTLVLAELS